MSMSTTTTTTTTPPPAAAAAPPPPPPPQPERHHGNLKDSDRIFTNLYGEWDPYIKGAMRRVCSRARVFVYARVDVSISRGAHAPLDVYRATGTAPKTCSTRAVTGSSTR